MDGHQDDLTTDEITSLLKTWKVDGDLTARERALRFLYADLLRIANLKLSREHTMSPGTIVQEVWKKIDAHRNTWVSREHFLNSAAKLMGLVIATLVERRKAVKRGSGQKPVSLDAVLEHPEAHADLDTLVWVNDAIERLPDHLAEILRLRHYAGATLKEIAEQLDLTASRARTRLREAELTVRMELKRPPSP